MKEHEDAYGRLLLAYLEGDRVSREIAERDGGFIAAGLGPAVYFEPFRRWPAHQRRAMRFVRGRVLDVGAGAGRVALHLQERGHDVVAIDVSPLAVEVCRRRGVRDARVCPFERIDASLGSFDTVVMWGNNFGLFGDPAKAVRMLRRLDRLTTDRGRIVAESRNVYDTHDPEHLAYHERNRRRGRMAGQLRLRIRHRSYATPWFDYLIVSPQEMVELLDGTVWHVSRLLDGDEGVYAAVIEKS
ncbi:MAG TPA: class I SAM-dependent methyltransferase [Gaiellaceae bacterium]|nr:class I SAM-dependent methyltransferase [Gaiellaceae bacterium]